MIKKTETTLHSLAAAFTIAILVAGCASPQPTASQTNPAKTQKQPTLERFVAELVTPEMEPAKAPLPRMVVSSTLAWSKGSKFETIFSKGNYFFRSEPAVRKPFRITLFGVPDSLRWSIDDSSVATLSAVGREATVDFKRDGRANIIVKSGDAVVFRLVASAVIDGADGKQIWGGNFARVDEHGQEVDMYGDVIN